MNVIKTKIFRRIILKTSAIVEKNVLIHFRFKYPTIIMYIRPLISILMPIIILEKFFEFNTCFGPWTSQNYLVFIFTGYNVLILKRMISSVPNQLMREKFWKTLPILIIAPFNRFNLLFGFMISELLIISIPFIIFCIITFVFYPISFLTLIIILLFYLGISLLFTSIGLTLGVLAVTNESLWRISGFIIDWIFWFSCITYPFEFFPEIFKVIINLNPIYYFIDLLRLVWIENNIFYTINAHFFHFLIFFSSILIIPLLGVYIFSFIYKKLESSGY